MRSSADRTAPDPFAQALNRALARVREAVLEVDALNPVVLIDGRSGAGKSTLAASLVNTWPLPGLVQSVALDSIYPGWGGLSEGAEIACRDILLPHARDAIGVWRRFDWESGDPAEAHAVDPSLPLVVEGAGVLTPHARRLCDVAIWVDAPDASRKRRALDRDGDLYRPHWERWSEQEEAHLRENCPQSLASLVIDLP